MSNVPFREQVLRGMIGFIYDLSEPDKAKARTKLAFNVISLFCRKGFDFETGSTRITFIGSDFVYKLPKNYSGVRANINEAKYYRSEGKKFPVAACRVIYLDENKLLPILMMEKVEPLGYGSPKPDWAEYYVDGGQVGINRKGEIVAYDL